MTSFLLHVTSDAFFVKGKYLWRKFFPLKFRNWIPAVRTQKVFGLSKIKYT